MKKSFTPLLQLYAIITLSFCCMAILPSIAYAQTLAFENVNVIPMHKNEVQEKRRVIVTEDKIVKIESMDTPQSVEVNQSIDASGLYMLPGLSDAHFHQHGDDFTEPKLQFKLLIANGITSVRNMAEWPNQDAIATRVYANQADTLAPYFFTVGPQVNAGNVNTPKQAIEMVQHHAQRGYDYIKIHGNLDKQVYLTLLEEANKANIPVLGHAQRKMPLEYSLRLKSLAHVEELVTLLSDEDNLKMVDLTPELAEEVAQQVRNSGIYVSPTLTILSSIEHYVDDEKFAALKQRPVSAFLNQGTIEYFSDKQGGTYRGPTFRRPEVMVYIEKLIKNNDLMVKALYDAGVPLLVGTDNFGFQITGYSIHDEMQKMVDVGMTEYDVLKAATVNSARYFNRLSQAGTISEGKQAEFVLLGANPLEDIGHVSDVRGVMLKGQYLDREALDTLIDDVLKVRENEKAM